MTDIEIVQSTLVNPDAYAGIVEKYEEKIKRYVRNFLYISTEDAEDIVQETFINAYRYLLGFNQTLSFSAWLYRIAHNQCVSYLRKHGKRLSTEYIPKSEEDDFLETIANDYDVEEEVGKALAYKRIEQGLAKLSPQYREILLLRFMYEKEYTEISDVLKVPEGTIASLIHRAKAKLIELLKNE